MAPTEATMVCIPPVDFPFKEHYTKHIEFCLPDNYYNKH
jgi:hypothetical protein